MTTDNVSKVRTYTRTQTVEAQQFFHDEAEKGNVPPGVTGIDDFGRRDDGTFGPLRRAYFVNESTGHSWRLKDTDWVVYDPLAGTGYFYFTNEQFVAQFREKGT